MMQDGLFPMKKIGLFVAFIVSFTIVKAQTATDFTALDCAGNTFNLFDELDGGKIIVITWTMPCGACVSGSLTAYNVAQSFEIDYPGKVKMLLVDDFANTPCSAINAWGNSYGITRAIKFSDAAIAMSDYGIAGMPKTIAIAPDRSVIFNENNSVNGDSLQAAINAVLQATTAVDPISSTISKAVVSPNPASGAATIKFELTEMSKVRVSIYSLNGIKIQEISNQDCSIGEHIIPFHHATLSNGLYHIRLEAGLYTTTLPLLLSR